MKTKLTCSLLGVAALEQSVETYFGRSFSYFRGVWERFDIFIRNCLFFEVQTSCCGFHVTVQVSEIKLINNILPENSRRTALYIEMPQSQILLRPKSKWYPTGKIGISLFWRHKVSIFSSGVSWPSTCHWARMVTICWLAGQCHFRKKSHLKWRKQTFLWGVSSVTGQLFQERSQALARMFLNRQKFSTSHSAVLYGFTQKQRINNWGQNTRHTELALAGRFGNN